MNLLGTGPSWYTVPACVLRKATLDKVLPKFVEICEQYRKGLWDKERCYVEQDALVKAARTDET